MHQSSVKCTRTSGRSVREGSAEPLAARKAAKRRVPSGDTSINCVVFGELPIWGRRTACSRIR